MADRDLHIVSYDISSNRRRTRFAKALGNFGSRVQYSVFECLIGAKQVETICQIANRLIDRETDSVRIYRLCPRCAETVAIIGWGEVTAEEDVRIV